VAIENFLKKNKIKKLNATEESIKNAVKKSDFLELSKDELKLKRKENTKIPDLSLLGRKKMKNQDQENDKKFDEVEEMNETENFP
jgi:hypothetical protein